MSAPAIVSARDSYWIPTSVNPWVRALAVASLLSNGLLIFTGGLVRLTASGMGCPTWPRCSAESWTNTPEMGLHGLIEFGNRTLTFVLAVVAVLTFVSVLRLRHQYPGIFRLALVLGLGVPLQAVLGGITVHVHLSPLVVGVHYLLSASMCALATLLVLRTRRAALPTVAYAQRPGQLAGRETLVRVLATVAAVLSAALVYVGTLVTGTGPHAGDEDSARLAFDSLEITRLHAIPAYLLVFTVVAGLVLCTVKNMPAVLRHAYLLLGAVLVAQALVGYYQYFNHVPVPAVSLHMVLSVVLIWAATRLASISFRLAGDPADDAAERAIARESAVAEPLA